MAFQQNPKRKRENNFLKKYDISRTFLTEKTERD